MSDTFRKDISQQVRQIIPQHRAAIFYGEDGIVGTELTGSRSRPRRPSLLTLRRALWTRPPKPSLARPTTLPAPSSPRATSPPRNPSPTAPRIPSTRPPSRCVTPASGLLNTLADFFIGLQAPRPGPGGHLRRRAVRPGQPLRQEIDGVGASPTSPFSRSSAST